MVIVFRPCVCCRLKQQMQHVSLEPEGEKENKFTISQ